MVLAYWMMLIVMTYETDAFTALILGLVQSSPLQRYSAYETQFKTAPCCQTTS